MRNNLNPDRVRLHAARSTPDRISRLFSVSSPDGDLEIHQWLMNFRKMMLLKHPEPGWNITLFKDDKIDFTYSRILFNKILFTVEARPPEPIKYHDEYPPFNVPIKIASFFKISPESLDYHPPIDIYREKDS